MAVYLITGASSGLGFQVALRLARQRGHRLVLPMRNPDAAAALVQSLEAAGAASVATPALDLASLASVQALLNDLAQAVDGQSLMPFDGVLLNAGRQSASKIEFTADGFESTFAVNHLAHHLLIQGLLPRLRPQAMVGWTASGTHDPKETSARLSGFRGAQYTTALRLAQAEYEPGVSPTQACKDAYATSKLCNIVSARAFAQQQPHTRFFSFDPGLMPGTGLAREHGAAQQWIWRRVLPRLASLLPGTSSTEASAEVLTRLLTGELRGSCNGAYFNYTGKQLEPAAPATERWVADDLMQASDALLARVRQRDAALAA